VINLGLGLVVGAVAVGVIAISALGWLFKKPEPILSTQTKEEKEDQQQDQRYLQDIQTLEKLIRSGRFEPAEQLADRLERDIPLKSPHFVRFLITASLLYGEKRDYAHQESTLLRAMDLTEDREETAIISNSLVTCYSLQQNDREAEKWATECERIRASQLKVSPKDTEVQIKYAFAALSLAIVHGRLGNFQQANEMYGKATSTLIIFCPATRETHRGVSHFAADLYSQGLRDETVKLLQRYLEVLRSCKVVGSELFFRNNLYLETSKSLAAYLFLQKQYVAAEEVLNQAISQCKEQVDGQILCDRATVCYELGKHDDALETEAEIRKVYERIPVSKGSLVKFFTTKSIYLQTLHCLIGSDRIYKLVLRMNKDVTTRKEGQPLSSAWPTLLECCWLHVTFENTDSQPNLIKIQYVPPGTKDFVVESPELVPPPINKHFYKVQILIYDADPAQENNNSAKKIGTHHQLVFAYGGGSGPNY